jgi:hypothetical protein
MYEFSLSLMPEKSKISSFTPAFSYPLLLEVKKNFYKQNKLHNAAETPLRDKTFSLTRKFLPPTVAASFLLMAAKRPIGERETAY